MKQMQGIAKTLTEMSIDLENLEAIVEDFRKDLEALKEMVAYVEQEEEESEEEEEEED
jgi:hypothetical protein